MAGKSGKAKDSGFSSLMELVIQGRLRIPRDSVVFLDPETVSRVFTRKRAEVLKTIKGKKPKTIKELAKILNRKVQAVDRDVKALEAYELIRLERSGREARPVIYKEACTILIARKQLPERVKEVLPSA